MNPDRAKAAIKAGKELIGKQQQAMVAKQASLEQTANRQARYYMEQLANCQPKTELLAVAAHATAEAYRHAYDVAQQFLYQLLGVIEDELYKPEREPQPEKPKRRSQ